MNNKPDIKNLKPRAKIDFLVYDDRGKIYDNINTLLDNNINPHSSYGVMLCSQNDNYIEFEVFEKVNIYAYGEGYHDGGGSSPRPVTIFKKLKDDYIVFNEKVETKDNKWYLLCKELDKGVYKIKHHSNYVSFSEWYVEKCIDYSFIIKCDDLYYTIDTEFYKDGVYKQIPELDFEKYGFDDLNDLFKTIKIGDDSMTPIDKFKDKKINILMKEI